MTREEATTVVEGHIRWLRGEGDRASVADALTWLFYYMGAQMGAEAKSPVKGALDCEMLGCNEAAQYFPISRTPNGTYHTHKLCTAHYQEYLKAVPETPTPEKKDG